MELAHKDRLIFLRRLNKELKRKRNVFQLLFYGRLAKLYLILLFVCLSWTFMKYAKKREKEKQNKSIYHFASS